MPLLEKYKDYDTNPANETIDRVFTGINNPNGGFYKILVDTILVGRCYFYSLERKHTLNKPNVYSS